MNKLLSICIPTYNRAALLDDTLGQLILQAEPHRIPIYVSDNASPDNTASVVSKWQQTYPFLYYNRNDQNIGGRNYPILLRMPSTRYSWMMGDRTRLANGAIRTVLSIIESGAYDLIVVNSRMKLTEQGFSWKNRSYEPRVRHIPSTVYADGNVLLEDLGWHMTLINSLIFGSSLIHNGDFSKYAETEFPHFLTAFDYLAQRDFSVYWCDQPLVHTAPGGSSQWLHNTFEVLIPHWMDAVNSLPSSYTVHAKLTCIKLHGIKSGLFSIKAMSFLRGNNIYSLAIFKKYYSLFPSVTNTPRAVLFLIALMPPVLFKAIEAVIRLFVPDLVRIPAKR